MRIMGLRKGLAAGYGHCKSSYSIHVNFLWDVGSVLHVMVAQCKELYIICTVNPCLPEE